MVWSDKKLKTSKTLGSCPRLRYMVTMVQKEQNKIQNGVSKYSQFYLLFENQDRNMGKGDAGTLWTIAA